MKYLLVSIVIGLSGCHSTPAPSVLPAPAKPVAAIHPTPTVPVAAPAPASGGLEQKLRQQAQYIEALISQNDALTAKLAGTNGATPLPPTVVPLPPDPAPLPRPVSAAPTLPSEATLIPNADNVIDLVAFVVAEKPGEPVNPFTVRTVPPDAMREVTLHVGGIVAGPIACAVINDRLVQVGEIVESLAVERIEADAVLFRHSGRLLRLPVAEKATRVRLPL
ncbi:MAG: hypothetical protein RIQ93_2244 [Verrucomicrobiota bacterium]|jgi:hypothetical protein